MSLTALIFLFVFLVGCGFALLRHPIFGVMTYIMVFYVSPSDRWWGQGLLQGGRWALVAAVVAMVALSIHKPKPQQIPLFRQPLMIGFIAFTCWVALLSFWALDRETHIAHLVYYLKYIVAMYLIYRSVDSAKHLKLFLWAHVLGCAYLAWLAFRTHQGGRFDAFGGAGIGDANSGALTLVTGILAAASLFLAGRWRQRVALSAIVPLLINGVIATISRSGFLAFGVGGIVFNLFTPKQFRKWVRILSVLGLGAFLLLTNPDYWNRIQSLQFKGEQVEGVDTGSKRLVLMQAQLRMSREYPLGCGASCTDVLSPYYLEEKQLAGEPGGDLSRSSHNTFMTMLVDFGWPGAAFYLLMVAWIVFSLAALARTYRRLPQPFSIAFPAVAGSLAAITVGDMFVQYPKLEVRFWFLTIVMVMLSMAAVKKPVSQSVSPKMSAHARPDLTGTPAS